MFRDYDSIAPVTLEEGLRMLREDVEGMDYHPARPLVAIKGGTWLQPQLDKSEDGGQLLGCWHFDHLSASTGELLCRHGG